MKQSSNAGEKLERHNQSLDGKGVNKPPDYHELTLFERILISLNYLCSISWVLIRFSGFGLLAFSSGIAIIFLVLMLNRPNTSIKGHISAEKQGYIIGYLLVVVFFPLALAYLIALPIYRYGLVSLPGIIALALLIFSIAKSWRKNSYKSLLYSFSNIVFFALVTTLPLFQVTRQDMYVILALTAMLFLIRDAAVSKMMKA